MPGDGLQRDALLGLQVRLLQCALARFLQDVVSCGEATFPIAQQRGLQAGSTPTLLLMNDMLFQASVLHAQPESVCTARLLRTQLYHGYVI